MKLPCKVIEDILPMYHDQVCAEESAALVEEHIKTCSQCAQMLANLRSDMDIPKSNADDTKPLKKIQKSYKKLRLGWLLAILAVVLLTPLAFLFGNRHSEVHAPSVAYTKEEATALANAFMTCLVEKDYAKAFSYWDLPQEKADLSEVNTLSEEVLRNFEADGLRMFCAGGEKLDAWGGIQSFQLIEVSAPQYSNSQAIEDYSISYSILFDGKEEHFKVSLTKNGIHNISGADGLVRHPLSHLTLWVQWVVDEYSGRYYDFDAGQWVDVENAG